MEVWDSREHSILNDINGPYVDKLTKQLLTNASDTEPHWPVVAGALINSWTAVREGMRNIKTTPGDMNLEKSLLRPREPKPLPDIQLHHRRAMTHESQQQPFLIDL